MLVAIVITRLGLPFVRIKRIFGVKLTQLFSCVFPERDEMKLWLLAIALGACVALKVEAQKKVVCYYGSWAVYRPGNGKFDVEDIDPFLCTHLIFGFAGLDPVTYGIRVLDAWNELPENWGKNAYGRFNNLRIRNPALKTLIAIGGWNEGSVTYSKMAADPRLRRQFIDSMLVFMQKYPFDGLDFDWEYPANRGGNEQIDKANFVILLKELREEFDKHGWLLTAAVSAGKATIDSAYDIPGVARYLHFINVMTYDFHGAWETFTGHNAPLNARPSESLQHHLLTVNYSINYWLNQGASRDQIILGMGLYGRSFTLVSDQYTDSGAGAIGPGTAGPYTREPGTLGYNEICEARNRWNVVQDPHYRAPYAYYYNQWVGYDDIESIKVKCQFANSLGLGGGMVWSIETDDFRGGCHGEKFPLINTIKRALNNGGVIVDPVTQGPRPTVADNTPSRAEFTNTEAPRPTVKVTTRKPDGNADCPSAGTHRDKNDCSRFHYCEYVNGVLIITSSQQCPPGLLFDEVSENCKWAKDVECNL